MCVYLYLKGLIKLHLLYATKKKKKKKKNYLSFHLTKIKQGKRFSFNISNVCHLKSVMISFLILFGICNFKLRGNCIISCVVVAFNNKYKSISEKIKHVNIILVILLTRHSSWFSEPDRTGRSDRENREQIGRAHV